ncbi:hypothetical protein Vretimale_17582 [Volvox reticuliferus]|uniref:Uncharacterized protein n=1 Tax=Volvox reticuliferus TaxID=1737510 RepID=A0A8J4C4X8_9CHLO|nr:hypothetical protein Vretifemale_3545 [Volvox reticuliferus]GIM14775.1 hypothetical protein Vretimale_17582 [Volvox reticuliferus]
MAKPITGKTVVVTGGSRGIGLGLVKKFLARNNLVIATSRKSSEATHLHELHKQYPEHLILTDLDTSTTSSITAWAQHIKQHKVANHVDLLVNNAGVYGRRLDLQNFEDEDFLFAFRANTMGPFFVVQQLLKQELLGTTREAPDGKSLIANMSSIVGSNADPTVSAITKGGFPYRASKAALNVISTTLARDLAPQGIEVVALHPGYVQTDMTGGNGWISVEESTTGLMTVLESEGPLNGRFFSYNGTEIPW